MKSTQKQRKRNYACFIDFRKAFDSIGHENLFLKLRKLGVSDLFYNVIKNMYLNNNLCVKTSSGLTPYFISKVGVRQGCALSPLLFNLYISDLSSCLDSSENITAIKLHSKRITHLLYADDLVLIAESENDLQSLLDSLGKYCLKWGLSINHKKSKVIIFTNNCGVRPKKLKELRFYIDNSSIEIVGSYKYLGVVFSENGSFKMACSHLDKQAKRALFGLHSYINDDALPPDICCELFDRLILPVASYGAEVWAPSCIKSRNLMELQGSIFSRYLDFPGTSTQLKFDKRLLHVPERSINLATLGELGHYPPIVSVLCKIVNFWLHILQSSDKGLLYDAYLCGYDQFYKNNTSNKWFQIIKLLSSSYHPEFFIKNF